MGKAGTKVFQLKEDPNDESFGSSFIVRVNAGLLYTAMSYYLFYKKDIIVAIFLKSLI